MGKRLERAFMELLGGGARERALAVSAGVLLLLLTLYIVGAMEQIDYAIREDVPASYAPLTCLWTALYGTAHGEVPFLAPLLIFAALIILASLAYASLTEAGPLPGPSYSVSDRETHGSAYMMTRAEADRKFRNAPVSETRENILGLSGDGMNVYSDDPADPLERGNGFSCMIAASGRRKTRSFVIPMIFQAMVRGESVVVTDPKGELFDLLAGLAKETGYVVRVLNTKSMYCSDGFEPLSALDLEVREEGRPPHNPLGDPVEIVQKMVDVIVKNTMARNAKTDDFFVNSEKMLLTLAMLYVSCKEKYNITSDGEVLYGKSLAKVYEFLMQSPKQICAQIEHLPDRHPARALARDYLAGSDIIKESARKGCTNILKELEAPSAKQMFSYNDIDLSLPGKEKCLYFVVTPALHSEKNWMAGLFYSLLFMTLVEGVAEHSEGRRLPVPVNVILEEFPSTAYIPDFPKILNTVRSAGIRIAIIAQNIAQMKGMFPGVEYQTIMEAFDTNICGGVNAAGEDGDTADYYSKMSGVCTEDVSSSSRSASGFMGRGIVTGETVSAMRRPVLTPDEVRDLRRDEQLIFLACCHLPLRLRKFDCSMHPLYEKALAAAERERPASAHVPLYSVRAADYANAPRTVKRPAAPAGTWNVVAPENRNDGAAWLPEFTDYESVPPAPAAGQGRGRTPSRADGQSYPAGSVAHERRREAGRDADGLQVSGASARNF